MNNKEETFDIAIDNIKFAFETSMKHSKLSDDDDLKNALWFIFNASIRELRS